MPAGDLDSITPAFSKAFKEILEFTQRTSGIVYICYRARKLLLLLLHCSSQRVVTWFDIGILAAPYHVVPLSWLAEQHLLPKN